MTGVPVRIGIRNFDAPAVPAPGTEPADEQGTAAESIAAADRSAP
jgi:hypothetical protein